MHWPNNQPEFCLVFEIQKFSAAPEWRTRFPTAPLKVFPFADYKAAVGRGDPTDPPLFGIVIASYEELRSNRLLLLG